MKLAALRAGWLTQTFVHWAFEPEHVMALLPSGLTVDTYDGMAWVSLTPFVMARVRPAGLPGAGFTCLETNLRTYVLGPDGSRGLWFLSIEVNRAVMLGARAVGAPYHRARLDLSRAGGALTYTGHRRGAGAAYRLRVRPGRAIEPVGLDVWLTSLWRAYTSRLGRLWRTPVEHGPWPLREAAVDVLEESLTRAAGLPAPGGEPLVHFSDGVEPVRLGLTRPTHLGHAPGRGRHGTDTATPRTEEAQS
ncbi:YqjF family protein [Kitasatospora sp. NPDC001547]|uniref:YqjF family protein n=1 Tax=Kitasatospora sp. NPDC001547 TaxID=3364015 RepID=UPI003680C614